MPRLYGEESLIHSSSDEWKQFCHDKQIAITDLISAIEDAHPNNPDHVKALAGYADNAIIHNFDGFAFVNIVQLLQRHPSIQNVYFTRGLGDVYWRHLWNPVAHYCNHNKLHERKLLTPSGNAFYQNAAHNKQNPDNIIPRLEDYILSRWKKEWHF
jgi:hypothetical protein